MGESLSSLVVETFGEATKASVGIMVIAAVVFTPFLVAGGTYSVVAPVAGSTVATIACIGTAVFTVVFLSSVHHVYEN